MMTLQPENCRQRREQLISQIEADTIVISNPRHVQYFCAYYATPLHIGTWGTPHLIINTKNGESTLFSHNFASSLESAFVDKVETWHWYDGVHAPQGPVFAQMVTALSKMLKGRIAFESGYLPHGVTDTATVDVTPTIMAMRRHKNADELALIRACISATQAGHSAARSLIQPGVTELDVYNGICAAIVNAAAAPVLPLGDFVSGERAYKVGGHPTERIIQHGDIMIIDIFPIIGGYRADITASYVAAEALSNQQQKLEAALHAALQAGESQLRAGIAASNIYEAVNSALSSQGYGGHFPHHAGHGLGLGHPEAPFFVADSTDVLQIGDVVTLEPGAYGADFGGRIEHNYLISETGFERLSQHDTRFLAG